MVRSTNAVASRRRRKKLLKQVKGYWGDRKNHFRNAKDANMKALANNFAHRKKKKNDFRRLWIQRINVAARINGLSYSRMIDGLAKAGVAINRKMLADLAVRDPQGFAAVADSAKKALA